MFFKKNFAHENMKKPASKIAEPGQIQPKSQFLFHKNLPPRDFSIMTLDGKFIQSESNFATISFPEVMEITSFNYFYL